MVENIDIVDRNVSTLSIASMMFIQSKLSIQR